MSAPFPSGPVPAYSNPPINPQYYQPSRFVISAVTNGSTTLITTAVNHNYVIGQTIRVLIPNTYGCVQINGQQGNVISIPAANQVVVTIDSSNANSFQQGVVITPPQIIAIGDINSGFINATGRIGSGTYVPGSFIDISPN